ncbi:hypothetical protein PAHAL_2G058200 [Panicum hallii]|uniref:Uncharacterized protein n=1 Tax=Panicum hallii TaxID=206008 RepID=A0A2T8KN16_9POAL|nr:hypothetical protein PAHAL_2G058200 [Panicum hallii]
MYKLFRYSDFTLPTLSYRCTHRSSGSPLFPQIIPFQTLARAGAHGLGARVPSGARGLGSGCAGTCGPRRPNSLRSCRLPRHPFLVSTTPMHGSSPAPFASVPHLQGLWSSLVQLQKC